LKQEVESSRKTFNVDWHNLQKPGFSPDFIERRYRRMDTTYEVSDWITTNAGRAFLRNNQPLLAYIAGKPARFTSKDHNFNPGEIIEKQIIIINNSRETVSCEYTWSFDLPKTESGSGSVTVETGEQERIPLKFLLQPTLKPGVYILTMKATFSSGDKQQDSFTIHVMPPATSLETKRKIALFDPKGETHQFLSEIGIRYELVDANVDLSSYNILIIGKGTLTVDNTAPNIDRISAGLKVLIFEQSSEVLEKRFGFRVQEYGLRRVFRRIPDHPALFGLDTLSLRDWRGQATIVPTRLKYEFNPKHYPTVKWCGMKVTRAWRCGNYGNVASVMIEKPVKGDFLPIVDGGFNLQYSPLIEYHEGKGIIVFCQMDVTGRTEYDPAAIQLVANILKYVVTYKPLPNRKALYVGETAGWNYFKKTGISMDTYEGDLLTPDKVLIVGPGGGKELAIHKDEIASWLKKGGHILAIGLDDKEANAFLPFEVKIKKSEHISAFFKPAGMKTLLAGIGAAEVCIRDPRDLPLISEGARTIGNGVLAVAKDSTLVFCQLAPWHFDYRNMYHVKITFRRTAFLVARILGNMGVKGTTPLIFRFSRPLIENWYNNPTGRWSHGFYMENPVEMDDPYRFFRW